MNAPRCFITQRRAFTGFRSVNEPTGPGTYPGAGCRPKRFRGDKCVQRLLANLFTALEVTVFYLDLVARKREQVATVLFNL